MARIPSHNQKGWADYFRSIMPGLLVCLVLGFVAKWIDHNVVPDELFMFNYVLIAIVLGLLAKNVGVLPPLFSSGIEFATKMCLYIGIVLLGARLNLTEIFTVGSSALVMVAISITMCILVCGWMAKRIGASERWGHLVGTGIGVCGVSAIIALAPAIKARKREILAAIGAALLTDVLALLALPWIGHLQGWSDTLAGFMSGVVPSNTAQCIAIGHAYSDAAGTVATIVKSARNAFMPVVILILTYVYTIKGLPVGESARASLLWNKFPKFIVGMIIAAALSTSGLLTAEAIEIASDLSSWFFVVCFVGIGAGIDIREIGGQDLSVISFGFIMTILLAIYAYLYSTLVLVL